MRRAISIMLLTRCASLVAPRAAARGALRRAASAVADGYALAPDADGVGGWLAHRSDVGVAASGPGDDWIAPPATSEYALRSTTAAQT